MKRAADSCCPPQSFSYQIIAILLFVSTSATESSKISERCFSCVDTWAFIHHEDIQNGFSLHTWHGREKVLGL